MSKWRCGASVGRSEPPGFDGPCCLTVISLSNFVPADTMFNVAERPTNRHLHRMIRRPPFALPRSAELGHPAKNAPPRSGGAERHNACPRRIIVTRVRAGAPRRSHLRRNIGVVTPRAARPPTDVTLFASGARRPPNAGTPIPRGARQF